MSRSYEISEVDDLATLLELVEEDSGKAIITMGGTDRFVVLTAERYRALQDGYTKARERSEELRQRIEELELQAESRTQELAAAEIANDVQAATLEEAPEIVDATVRATMAETAAAQITQNSRAPKAPSCDSEKPYRLAELPNTPIDSDDYQRSMWQDAIVERMKKVIDAEAPVEKQRLFNTVRGSFGIKRSGKDIQAHNDWLFGRNINAKQTEFNGSVFVWRADQNPDTYDIFRPTDEKSNRQITEYPFEELKAAIKCAISSAGKLSLEELIEATMRTLGYKRKTSRVREVIGAAVERAADEGAIRIFTDGTFRVM